VGNAAHVPAGGGAIWFRAPQCGVLSNCAKVVPPMDPGSAGQSRQKSCPTGSDTQTPPQHPWTDETSLVRNKNHMLPAV